MTWCPFAIRLELNPESYQQATIIPDQFIVHSIAAPWDERRMYEYWRDSTNLESTFGLDTDGSMGQYLSTTTRADANYKANIRPNGHGAVSVETYSNLKHTDPWTPAQIEMLIRLGVWLHDVHGIPLRKCRTWDDPGYGYHSMHPQWSTGGTACPGDARIRQFNDIIFPEIVRRATHSVDPGPTPVPPAQEETVGLGPVMLPVGVTGPDSDVTIPVDFDGGWRLNVSANYVPPGEKVRIRIDVMNPNGSPRDINVIWDFINGQWGFKDVDGPGTIAVQKLTHPGAHVAVTLVKR